MFNPAVGWRLHPQVAVRPEPFGALLYHFGTRKLSFLKDRTILTIVQSLGEYADVFQLRPAAVIPLRPHRRSRPRHLRLVVTESTGSRHTPR